MQQFDLQPTDKNIQESITNDTTGRNFYLAKFITLLNNQTGPWSVALDASWGSGKTFFVKECQLVLNICTTDNNLSGNSIIAKLFDPKGLSKITKISYNTVYFDAWENDNDIDPVLSIINSISLSSWKDTAVRSINILLDIASKISAITLHVDPKSYIDSIRSNLKGSNTEEELKQKFSTELSRLIPQGGRLVIFIDELDRCKPTYAVKLLERIKHYFTNENVTFVFSVDLSELQNTVKHFYGEQFDGLQYLDRFFDLVIPLPEPDIEKYYQKTNGILEVSALYNSDQNYFKDVCKSIIKHFRFSIREINHFYLRLNSAIYNSLDKLLNSRTLLPNESNGRFVLVEFILPIMVALNMHNTDEYRQFINGNNMDILIPLLVKTDFFARYCEINKSEDDGEQELTNIVQKLYQAIFNPTQDSLPALIINDHIAIEYPSRYRKDLIDSSSLLSGNSKY